MLPIRALLVLGSLLVFGCECGSAPAARPQQPEPEPAPTSNPSARPPQSSTEGEPGLEHVEIVTGGASRSGRLPLIVAIHGLGDRPRSFAGLFEGFPTAARVLLPRGPASYSGGYSWFAYTPDRDVARLSNGIAAAADRVARWLDRVRRERPTRGEPIVTGFSQGGMLSYALAVRHPAAVGEAYPVGGWLPEPLWPDNVPGPGAPPLVALHGTADRVVPFGPARTGARQLERLGYDLELLTFDGVGHTITRSMRARLFSLLEAACRRQTGAEQRSEP